MSRCYRAEADEQSRWLTGDLTGGSERLQRSSAAVNADDGRSTERNAQRTAVERIHAPADGRVEHFQVKRASCGSATRTTTWRTRLQHNTTRQRARRQSAALRRGTPDNNGPNVQRGAKKRGRWPLRVKNGAKYFTR